MHNTGFERLDPVQQALVVAAGDAVDDAREHFTAALPKDTPLDMLNMICVENVARVAIEGAINRAGHFSSASIAELAVRLASLAISVMPESDQCSACEAVGQVLHGAHHERMDRGFGITSQWFDAPPKAEQN